MPEPMTAPYGSWKSPISPDMVVAGSVRLGQIRADGDSVYWVEGRPEEAGRNVILRRGPDGNLVALTPPGYSARTRVHEYGGGEYLVSGGTVYFSNYADQRVYRQRPGEKPEPVTPGDGLRFADGVVDARAGRIIYVREDHRDPSREALNTLAAVNLGGDESGGIVLAGGADFCASPCIAPDGSRLAWLAWDHPNMPWDGCELWVGDFLPDGTLGRGERLAGGRDESIFQPAWSPEGLLHFVSDRTGWWNLYRWREGRVEPLCEMSAEFGVPQWGLGMSTYGFSSGGRLVCTFTQKGAARIALLEPETGRPEVIQTPYSSITGLRMSGKDALFVGASPSEAPSIVRLDLESRDWKVLRRSSEVLADPGYVSLPEAVEFPTEDGKTAHAFYYAPANRDCRGPGGEAPPLLVLSHGGPTSAASAVLNLGTQFWTSRGFAILDVNYGGSAGYGRAYRERLRGQWGVVDVDDCVNGARFLVSRNLADGRRLIIRGGSAGGYTTLAALAFRDVFQAGASYYGICDLVAMAKDTHKFESRYLDGLIGPSPTGRDLFAERSPIHSADRLSCPMILFQGLEDRIVPPNQAEMMFDAIRRKGIPVAYLPFEGEQHGFRRAENIQRSLEAELYFYSKIFGFELAEPVEPVRIENLQAQQEA